MIDKEGGATLLELLLAVVVVVGVVIMISLLFPKTSANITNNRQRLLASNFAAARIQEIKQQPYALIDATAANTAYFSSVNTTGAAGCDCSSVVWTGLGADATYSEDGITYTRQVCINLVNQAGGVWTSYCPNNPLTVSPPDYGLKNIRVHVSWTYGGNPQTIDTESLMTR